MTQSITITMPLPPKELWQNRPCHWIKRSKATKIYRHSSLYRAIYECATPGQTWDMASARLTFYWPDKRQRDIRNAEAAMKPAYDGIVDAGVIVDDDYEHLVHETTQFKFDKENPRVEITITEVNNNG